MRTLLHLLQGDPSRLLIVSINNGLLVHDGASHIAPLPNVEECGAHVLFVGVVVQGLKPADAHDVVHLVLLPRGIPLRHLPEGCNVLWPSATAPTNAVDETVLKEGSALICHLMALLVIPSHRIWQTRIGITEHPAVSALAQVLDEGLHVLGTESTVQADSIRFHMADAVPEGLVGLSTQGATRVVHNGSTHKHRNAKSL
mmetsp:Transcript_4320/g.10443  ORF Transcript_4320/g.10443 Transcript_4320/m.10443 type:complete len:200 (+) Transcript_4320:2184-2783(+)